MMIHNALSTESKANATKTTSGNAVKFGFTVSYNLKDAYRLDKEIRSTLWADTIRVEINKLKEYKVFQVMPEGVAAPEGHKHTPLQ